MRMKRLSIVAIMVLISLLLVACGNTNNTSTSGGTEQNSGNVASSENEKPTANESTEKMTFRIGIGLSESHPQYKGLVKFKEVLEAESNGKYDVQIFANGTVGDDRSMMEMLQLGTLDATNPATAVIANFVPEFAVFDFPFLFPNEQVADQVLDGPVGQELLDKLQAQGIVGLNYWELGFLNITNSKREVRTSEDFKGLKIRTMENQVHLDTLRALGANPTPMAFSELFTALQQGTVDGQQNPPATVVAQKFYEVQPYMTLTQHVYGPFVFMMSKMYWDKLSDEDKQLFMKAANAGRDEERRLIREENMQNLKTLEEQGMSIVELAPGEREKLQQLVQPVIDQYADSVGRDLVDKIYRAVEEVK